MKIFPVSAKKYYPVFVFLLIAAACTKIATTTIGSGLIPPVDGVFTKDTTLEIIAKNTDFDTISVGIGDDHIIGYIQDPLFGSTAASVALQMLPPYYPYTYEVGKDSLHLDSVVLSIAYRGFWGDSTKQITLHAFRMDGEQIFKKDSIYRNTKTFEPYGLELNENNIGRSFYIRDIVADTAHRNDIRIKLNNSFGDELLYNYDTTTAYKNDSLFSAYVGAIIIDAEKTGNTLLRTNLLDTGTKLILYYRFDRRDSVGKQDTTARIFAVNPFSSPHCNTILRNRSGTEMAQYLPSNSNPEDDKLYIQAGPGSYSTLQIKGLTGLPNMIVHRAEIIMEQIPDNSGTSDDLFTVPNLFLSGVNDSIRFAIPPSDPFDNYTSPSPVVVLTSQGIGNLASFGCFPKPKTDLLSGKQIHYYTFDITRYVQSVATRNIDTIKFALWAPYSGFIRGSETSPYFYPISSPTLNYPGIGRIRLGGGNNAEHKMRLHIIYSKP